MSILRKPYEISVWDDVWSTDKFVEQRLGIIGSDKMQSQSRVIEPELTQNVNGTKKFSFKLYKRYKDNITGELVENPFYNWLANERKVKLNYDGTWYDFVIKNISEPSSNYLYTYQLEDANVQELSKNGFNFIFDAELQNNLGTSEELAAKLLEGTDWEVDENCDVPVQTIDEALVYLKVTKTDGVVATQIIDQSEENQKAGIKDNGTITIPKDAVILAAYSSCTGRPHRFQFFYLKQDDKSLVELLTKDDNRFITNSNCQYYIDFVNPVDAYREYNNYTIPYEFETTTVVEYPGGSYVTLSSEFRGKRYGFTQQTQYIPGLERYVNLYKDADNKTYYGYEHTEYLSPILIQNLISGSQLKSTSGWVGTTTILNGDKATVEAVYGRNPGANFVSSLEDIANGQYNENNDYASYIKITFPDDANAIVLNSGPHDNRRLIGNMEVGDQYKIDCEYYGTDNNLQFTLGEYVYSPDGKYNSIDRNITFSKSNNIFTVTKSNYSKKEFVKNSEVRLRIKGSSKATYYIKSISLYKVAYYTDSEGKQEIITPDSAITGNENTVDTTYYYIDASTTPINLDSVIPTTIAKTLTYDTYKPVYNEGGCKVRTVTAKESNYFNILQSIAETFGQWLEINVTHETDGSIKDKSIAFRNYVGNNNYAGFKYGVNLKDIKRTYESKNLVTKLIVKQNSNEFAPNGFCTIARADANPTGENTIYDFQYFFNTGMMSARDYLETTYVVYNKNLDGIQGYFPRIRDLNIQIQKDNDTLLNLSKDLVQISAELEVATVGAKAALDGIEETDEQIRFLTGYNISGLNTYLSSIEDGKQILERSDVKKAIQEYSVYKSELKKYEADKTRLEQSKETIEDKYSEIADNIKTNTESKEALHKEFFATYCRFIQEGTWISEDYVDDEKYYADALSVLYNSCYPKVAYDVNVIEISKLPGYENYAYNLGDITFVEDKEFFGDDFRVEVSVTETTDNLDDPSKNKIKVQNFKDQFQDLFQKITATVQQTQYNTGSYEKAVALAEAGQERKQQFLTDALDGMSSRLAVAGQQTVVIDSSGITVTDDDTPSESIRMVGGAIMLSKQDANGETKWTTGLTSDGISANLITAGVINAGQIAIMNSDQPTFRWDSYGISAFDATWFGNTTSDVDGCKFVRFDKNGIYGINGGVNGLNWHPKDGEELSDIDSKATFALTWDGLKVTGNDAIAWIGKHDIKDEDETILASRMIRVIDKSGNETFGVDDEGNVSIQGELKVGDGTPIKEYIDNQTNDTKQFINAIATNLQNQQDGNITTYFCPYLPSKENYPATEWENEYSNHNGDLFYVVSPGGTILSQTQEPSNPQNLDYWINGETIKQYIDNEWILITDTSVIEAITHVGFCYRWEYIEGSSNNFWVQIQDSEITKALATAAKAQDTADKKRRIFTQQPIPPYDEGDLWVNATYGDKFNQDIVICIQPRMSGNFSVGDWQLSSNYQDKVDSNVNTENFSWKFSPKDGLYMYAGKQEKEKEVFKIYKDNNTPTLWMKGNGEFTGTITATNGKIGGLFLQGGYLTSNENKQSYDSGDYNGVFVGPNGIGLGKNVFTVNKDGYLVAKNATIEGGKIANFTIKNYTISSRTNFNEDETGTMSGFYTGDNDGNKSELTNRISLIEPEINDKTNYSTVRFFAGAPFDKKAEKINEGNFVVLEDGSVYASAINITGGSISIGDGKFTVDQDGNVVLAGSITWDSSSSPVKVLYSIESRDKPVSTSKYPANSKVDWHTNFNKDEDKFASYSYDGGKTWTEAVSIVGTPGKDGKDGKDGEDGADGSDAYVDRAVLLGLQYKDEDGLHPFTIGDETYMGLNASAIRTGYLGFKKANNETDEYYIDPFLTLAKEGEEKKAAYVSLPNFRIAANMDESDSYIEFDIGRLGAVEFKTAKSMRTTRQIAFTDDGIIMWAFENQDYDHRNCFVWENNDGAKLYCMRGTESGIYINGIDWDNSNFDLYVYGVPVKATLDDLDLRLAVVEQKLGGGNEGGDSGDTGGDTGDGHDHAFTELVDEQPSTCQGQGYQTWQCTYCDKTVTNSLSPNPSNHVGEPVEEGQDGGYRFGYWNCCGEIWSEQMK